MNDTQKMRDTEDLQRLMLSAAHWLAWVLRFPENPAPPPPPDKAKGAQP